MSLKNRSFLKLLDYTPAEIEELLDLAADLKAKKKAGIRHNDQLAGKNIALIFEKTSTRTRCSFEVAAHDLGMEVTYLDPSGSQIGKKESIADTARVLGRYYDCVVWRTYRQSDLEEFAELAGVPVINGLTDYAHPCQVLADLMTIREFKSSFDGLKMCFIGDGNNMANSLIVGGLKVGMEVSIACPKDYQPAAEVLEFAKGYGDKFSMTDVPLEAAKDADVLFTDVWTSMGEEAETEKRKIAFKGYQINDDIMAVAKADAMVQHCLPAHREEEITEKVFEAHANEIFEEAENRLHAQKAVMVKVMGPQE